MTLVAIACGECAVPFGLDATMYASRSADGKAFYCPNGHRISYSDSDLEKAKRRAATAEEDARNGWRVASERGKQATALRRSRSAVKGQLTRTRKRVRDGACPLGCGDGAFPDLAAHMAIVHPEPEPKKRSGLRAVAGGRAS